MLRLIILCCCAVIAAVASGGLYYLVDRMGTTPAAPPDGINGSVFALVLLDGAALTQFIITLAGRLRPSFVGTFSAIFALAWLVNYQIDSLCAAELAAHAHRTQGVIADIVQRHTGESVTSHAVLVYYQVAQQTYRADFIIPNHALARYHPDDSCVVYYSDHRPGISKAGPDTAGVWREIRHF